MVMICQYFSRRCGRAGPEYDPCAGSRISIRHWQLIFSLIAWFLRQVDARLVLVYRRDNPAGRCAAPKQNKKVAYGTMPNKLLKAIAEAVLAAIFKRLAPNDLRNRSSRHQRPSTSHSVLMCRVM